MVAARCGEVRLRVHKAHDARGLAADAGLGDVVAAGDVALERGCNVHTCTSRQDRRSTGSTATGVLLVCRREEQWNTRNT